MPPWRNRDPTMKLTGRALLLLLLTCIPLALSGVSAWFTGLALLWLVVMLALLLADWRLSPKPADWELQRQHDTRLSLAAHNRIAVTVRLHAALRSLPVWLRDEPPPTFAIAEHERIQHATIAPGNPHVFTYSVRPPRRGDYRFGDLHLRWQSVLGLLRRQTRVAATAAVKVYPNLVDVKKYDLLLRRNRLWDLGVRTTRLRGSGAEFERLRDYLPDDEYRRINWKATARRGKPISMEYESERSQQIIVMLDVGRMMRSPVGDVAKLDFAINAVLLLTYVAAQKGDKVGLLTFADNADAWLAPRSGKIQFQRMLELLYAVEGQTVEPDYNNAFTALALRQPKRSLVVVFSELTGSVSVDALIGQMVRLRQRHLPLLVTVSDPAVQRLARQEVFDSASLHQRTVAERLLDERTLILDRLQSAGVLTLDTPADELSIAVINGYLKIKARMML
jgi:uncharacterized protein (DUF58 family)